MENRPAHSLEYTIEMVLNSINNDRAIMLNPDKNDILYHLENFKRLLDWLNRSTLLDSERKLNAKDKS